jgi:hypothetical protein
LLLITGYGKLILLMVLINKTIEGTITYGRAVSSTLVLIGLILAVVLMMNQHYTKLGSGGCHTVKTDFYLYINTFC